MATNKRKPVHLQEPKSASERVAAYRAKVQDSGGSTLYANISADATKALDKIIKRTGYCKAGAVEFALMQASKALPKAA